MASGKRLSPNDPGSYSLPGEYLILIWNMLDNNYNPDTIFL